jgi:hypothetical protein
MVESLSDADKKKKYLKGENRLLRDQLKLMSENVNLLIEKMNEETLKKKKYGGTVKSSVGPTRIKAAEQEIINTDKAIVNLMKEHGNLKRRL